MLFLVKGKKERLALASVDHRAHDQLRSGQLSGDDNVAADGAIIIGRAVVAPVFGESLIRIGRVLVLVLTPVEVVAPDAVGAGQIVPFDRQ